MVEKKQSSDEEGRSSATETLEDYTLEDYWNKFFTIRGSDNSCEWYAEWPLIRDLIIQNLSFSSPEAKDVSILVPGCGNSRLSEHMYDAGFHSITNIDLSKVVITHMLKKYERDRPEMKWHNMNMTDLKFPDESFNAVVDKGGLDALMEPKHGPGLGNLYLSEVKRVLRAGGKYMCLTLAESHVIDLLFPKFRFGWKMSLHATGTPQLPIFVVVVEKDSPTAISDISLFLDECSVESDGDQARELYEALERERNIRTKYSTDSDVSYSIEDLKLGVKGNISVLQPGRRIELVLGESGVSNFSYKAMLLDAQPDSQRFTYHYVVYIVPQLRAHDWLYTSQEGQWLTVVSSKAARLLMVYLDSSNSIFSMEHIQKDLSPLVKQLAPAYGDNDLPIQFLAAGDGIKRQDIMHQNPRCFMDISIGGMLEGRLVFELFDKIVPKTSENFRALCTGEKGISPLGMPLHYKGSQFNRIVKGYMIACSGCGESVHGVDVEVEKTDLTNWRAGMLSLAPNTNGAGFIISTTRSLKIDGSVVFGRVVKGLGLLRCIEDVLVVDNFRPMFDIMIEACGEILPGEEDGTLNFFRDGDMYPDCPEEFDAQLCDIFQMIQCVESIKAVGYQHCMCGNLKLATKKYEKAKDYLNLCWEKPDVEGLLDTVKLLKSQLDALLENIYEDVNGLITIEDILEELPPAADSSGSESEGGGSELEFEDIIIRNRKVYTGGYLKDLVDLTDSDRSGSSKSMSTDKSGSSEGMSTDRSGSSERMSTDDGSQRGG